MSHIYKTENPGFCEIINRIHSFSDVWRTGPRCYEFARLICSSAVTLFLIVSVHSEINAAQKWAQYTEPQIHIFHLSEFYLNFKKPCCTLNLACTRFSLKVLFMPALFECSQDFCFIYLYLFIFLAFHKTSWTKKLNYQPLLVFDLLFIGHLALTMHHMLWMPSSASLLSQCFVREVLFP